MRWSPGTITGRVPRRDEVRTSLTTAGTGTEVYYPVPLSAAEVLCGVRTPDGDVPGRRGRVDARAGAAHLPGAGRGAAARGGRRNSGVVQGVGPRWRSTPGVAGESWYHRSVEVELVLRCCLVAVCATAGAVGVQTAGQTEGARPASASAVLTSVRARQVPDKVTLTPAQRKLTSDLLAAINAHAAGAPPAAAVSPRSAIDVDREGRVLVDLRAHVTDALRKRIVSLGGEVISAFPEYEAVRARLALDRLETIAEMEEVRSIRPADRPTRQSSCVRLAPASHS